MVGIHIGILTSVITATIMIFINAVVRRFKVKSVSDERIDEIMESVVHMKEHAQRMKEENKIIFKMIFPLLLVANGHKPNGELKEALRLYNTYLQEK